MERTAIESSRQIIIIIELVLQGHHLRILLHRLSETTPDMRTHAPSHAGGGCLQAPTPPLAPLLFAAFPSVSQQRGPTSQSCGLRLHAATGDGRHAPLNNLRDEKTREVFVQVWEPPIGVKG